MIAGPSSLRRNPRGPVAVKMQWLRNVSGLDGAPPKERRPVLPVGASHRHRCAKRSEILPRSERRKARTAWNADLWSARAGARNQHRWRCVCQHEFRETANRCLRRSAGTAWNADLWAVLPVGPGIARERETSTGSAAPCQHQFRNLHAGWRDRGASSGRLLQDRRGAQEDPIMNVARGGAPALASPPPQVVRLLRGAAPLEEYGIEKADESPEACGTGSGCLPRWSRWRRLFF